MNNRISLFQTGCGPPLLLGEGRNPLHGSVKERATKNKKEEKERGIDGKK